MSTSIDNIGGTVNSVRDADIEIIFVIRTIILNFLTNTAYICTLRLRHTHFHLLDYATPILVLIINFYARSGPELMASLWVLIACLDLHLRSCAIH